MKRIISLVLVVFLLTDLSISYKRYKSLNLDGDMVPILLPSDHYSKVLTDPLGLSVITNGEKYAGTNRYAAHKSMDIWFNDFHKIYSQLWKDKVACLYSLQGLFDILVHILMLFLLSAYVSRHTNFWKKDFILAAAILSPFFMTFGFGEIIGLVLSSVTYSFFYSLPMCAFLLFFLPFYISGVEDRPLKQLFTPLHWPIWTFLILYLSFSSVILLPISMITCSLIILANWKKRIAGQISSGTKIKTYLNGFFQIEKPILFFMISMILVNLYSFYIGTFNIENGEPIPLSERYLKLLTGIKVQLTIKAAYAFALLLLIINFIIIVSIYPESKKSKIFEFIKYCLIVSLIYILLLPFGGYRPYRPNILRFDTLLPVNVFLVFAIAASSTYLIRHLNIRWLKWYLPILILILSIFYFSDSLKFDQYYCQNDHIRKLQKDEGTTKPIILNKDCSVLGWEVTNWDVHKKQVNQMLVRWQILDHEKWYEYQ